jgi:4-amino-4-deoxy-L-arabinose transferase-like glycosyltransferase
MMRLLFLGFVGVVLLGGITAPLYRNEGLRALLAAEAVAARDWFTPRLYGEPHLTTPPGMGVLIALCGAGHVDMLMARLPSVLAGAVLIGLAGWVMRERFGRETGIAAMVLMPCSVLWLDRVPSAEIDLVQTAWVTGSLLALLQAIEGQRYRTLAWVVAMLCVAGGLFTKWTGPAFFYLTAVAWLSYRRQLVRLLDVGHLLGLAVVVGVFFVWAWHAHSAAGSEFFATLEREAMMRLSPARHPRPYPWGELLTFPLSFVLGCLPAVLLVPWAWSADRLDDRQRGVWSLAIAWVLVNLVFWTVVPGHRPRHILPAQPAVALLAAMGWYVWRRQAESMAYRAVVALACFWLVVKAGFVVAMHQRADIRPVAAQLREAVPPGEILGLVQLKDENLLFAYGRPAERGERTYSLMPAAHPWEGELVATLHDSQGEPLKLVRRPKGQRDPLASSAAGGDNR